MDIAGFPDEASVKDLSRRLHGFFRSRLPRDVDPRDLVADVLLTLSTYRGEASVKHYVFTVARNRLAEHRRRRRPIDSLPTTSQFAAADTGPSTALRRRELVEMMRAEVDAIEPPFGEVLALRLDGLEPREIAERIGVCNHTVRSRLVRGLIRLRERVLARWGASLS